MALVNDYKTIESTLEVPNQNSDKGLEVDVVTSEQAFNSLEYEWEILVDKSGGTVFQSFYWLFPWWKSYGAGAQLFILTVRKNDRLIGVAPFYLDILKIAGLPVTRYLRFIGSNVPSGYMKGTFIDYSVSDFLDVIVDQDHEHTVADCLLEELTNRSGEYHKIILQETRSDSWVQRVLLPEMRSREWSYRYLGSDVCPVLYLNCDDRDKLLQEFISKRKSRRKLNRMMESEKNFKVRILQSESEIEHYFPQFVALYQSRWNEMGYPGTFNDPRHHNFMLEVIRHKFKRHQLWFVVVETIEGEIIAFDINLLQGNAVYVYLGSFDHSSRYSKFSPGNAAQLFGIKHAVQSGIDELHLLRGDEKYKYDLTTDEIINSGIIIENPRKSTTSKNAVVRVSESWQYLRNLVHKELIVVNITRRHFGLIGLPGAYIKNLSSRIREKIKSRNTVHTAPDVT